MSPDYLYHWLSRTQFLNRTDSSKQTLLPIKSMVSWQQADAPLGYPVSQLSKLSTPAFDHRFIQLSAFEKPLSPPFMIFPRHGVSEWCAYL